ncbi:MAG: NAD(P)H-dependent glycerol-3-phosphate dehydrogenase [Solirubrobacteraceae bacterium]
MTAPRQVTVLGGGSWGTTVAALAANHVPTTLWARDPAVVEDVRDRHRNTRFLGDRPLPDGLDATTDLASAVAGADVLVMGVPSHAFRTTLPEVARHIRPGVPVASLAKGLEPGTHLRPTEIIAEELPGHPVAAMSGPNLAREVLDGLAAAVVVATRDEEVARTLQPIFSTDRFRVYRNDDIVGSELGGALKNVIAIASGMADGLGVGDNTRALVITRGLAEITRLGVALGADERTFSGLTGMGDLLATCISPLSRNRRVGEGLAQGRTLQQIVDEMGQVAEGVRTATTAMELSGRYGCRLPICHEVEQVVHHGRHPREAYRGLRRIIAESERHEVA